MMLIFFIVLLSLWDLPPHQAERGAMAHQINWNNLWLETDSTLVILAFKNTAFSCILEFKKHMALCYASPQSNDLHSDS
jgi:hypothetical protein